MTYDLVNRLRNYVKHRGGPAKDEDGKYIGTVWPMMLEAADEIEKLRNELKQIDTLVYVPSKGQHALTHFQNDFDAIRKITKSYHV